MQINTRSRVFLAVIAWLLPVVFVIPYALFAQRFRVLFWVIENFYGPFWITFFAALFLSATSSYLLLRANRLGLHIFQAGAALVILQTAFLAMSERRHLLLVIIFVLSAALVFAAEWMRRTLLQPFYDSGRRWWESYPKALPHIRAELVDDGSEGETRIPVRITNLGPEGCFIFTPKGRLSQEPRKLEIQGEGFALTCSVAMEVTTRDQLGWGLRFLDGAEDADWSKDLIDRIILLRRAGYVQN